MRIAEESALELTRHPIPDIHISDMNFTFGCAENLYAQNGHPRVMLGPADLKRLKQDVRKDPGRRLLAVLCDDMAALIELAFNAEDLTASLATWSDWYHDPVCRLVTALDDVAMAGVLDDDERAIEAVRRVLRAIPEADRRGNRSLWHGGAMLRIFLAYDLVAPNLSQADRLPFVRWAVDKPIRDRLQKLKPSYFKQAGANLVFSTVTTALMAILAIRGDEGVPLLDDELKLAVQYLEAALHCALGPDGYPEEDTGYGTSHLGNHLAPAAEAARRAGLYDAYRDCPRFALTGQAILHFVQPWGECLANTGDCTTGFEGRQFVLSRLATETKNPALLWLAEKLSRQFYFLAQHASWGKSGCIPADAFAFYAFRDLRKTARRPAAKIPTQFRDRQRGIVSFRSSWKPDATFVVFDGSQRSPAAQGHAHDSAGHFSLSALGEFFAIGPGRYNIEQDQHNVVLVDGKSGRSTDGQWRHSYYHGNLTDYRPGRFCDFAAADSTHQHNCFWARRYIGLVKGREAPSYAWTVEDINKANDFGEFWWTLNTSPANTITLEKGRAIVRGSRHGNRLEIDWVLPPPTAFPKPHALTLEQDIKTCGSLRYVGDPLAQAAKFKNPEDMIHRSVFLRPRLIAKIGGYNGRFMSVMVPRKKDEPPVSVEPLKSLDNSFAVKIVFDQVEDTLIFAYEHNLLEADGVNGRGQWCVVRRSRKTRRVLAFELGHGTRLSVDGRSCG
ncbi:MAG: heparinase II/III family protein [Lentisphaerae bacterium]|nr:heparinase II/III family protein [Lentisphaerota bacterium]